MNPISNHFLLLFLLFSFFNLLGVYLNHIDDTDETHGYWEPLHYLLYGTGLQTWEYSPDYSIRTYSFIIPVYLYAYLLKKLSHIDKIVLFKCIRVLFGLITAYSEMKFLNSVHKRFGVYHYYFNIIFMLFSPGILFCSTSYLPSAICMNLIMLSFSAMMDGYFHLSICYGSIAVLWTGWPFVALLLIPIGINMIMSTLFNSYSIYKIDSPLMPLMYLFTYGAVIVLLVLVPSVLIDFIMYRKWYYYINIFILLLC